MSASAQLFALFRTALFVVFIMGTVLVYLPWWLGMFRWPSDWVWRWELLGIVPLLAGIGIALRCVFAFAWEGLGTPAPVDAPRKLVVTGWYRYVRNPMYWGAFLILLGEWALFGTGWSTVLYLAGFLSAVLLFVVFYEEPALQRKFGSEYEEYRRNVPRWIPRRFPWEGISPSPPSGSAG
ncbi:MAG TPA: isoprenylcysteine carboxylmethyltransferase family protein [Terriglobales bacterium]|nr:isoprenylcysteine carboxylmethyltransferase family protein [Terriglobales bacterium]